MSTHVNGDLYYDAPDVRDLIDRLNQTALKIESDKTLREDFETIGDATSVLYEVLDMMEEYYDEVDDEGD